MTINSIQTTNKNTCPHGLPVGTCPICNGGMGGGRQMTSSNTKKASNEWSWMKCYIEGRMMRGQEARQEAQVKFTSNPINIENSNVIKNFMNFTANVKNMLNSVYESLPLPLQNAFLKVANNILTPLNNLLSKIPNLINKISEMTQNIKELIMATSEKLAAIFGELKNFIDKKIFDKLKRLTKKMLRIFIWERDEEHLEIDEELEIFKSRELKKIKNAIFYLNKKEENK